MPLLLLGAQSSSDGKARVVNLSSAGHLTGNLDFNTFKDGPARRREFSFQLYAQSKFVCDFSVSVKYHNSHPIFCIQGNIVFANELARRYGGQGIVSCAVHPGSISTNLMRYIPAPLVSLAVRYHFLLHPLRNYPLTSQKHSASSYTLFLKVL
jgi:retinol dehydrogenase-12